MVFPSDQLTIARATFPIAQLLYVQLLSPSFAAPWLASFGPADLEGAEGFLDLLGLPLAGLVAD